jgi:DNA-binding beta-propeller fold protein YncE
VPGYGGDGGPATKAQISLPMAVAIAPDGGVYISDAGNSRIRRVAPDGTIQTVAGYGPPQDTYGGGYAGDGGPLAKAKLFSATDLKFDAAGNFYIVDSGNHRIRAVRNGAITTLAGTGNMGFGGDGGKASEAELNTPQKVAIASDGTVFISDRASHRIRKVNAQGVITTLAGAGNSARMIRDPKSRKWSNR